MWHLISVKVCAKSADSPDPQILVELPHFFSEPLALSVHTLGVDLLPRRHLPELDRAIHQEIVVPKRLSKDKMDLDICWHNLLII